MAQRNFRFPKGKTVIQYHQIGRFQAYPGGVGVFNLRDRMVDYLHTANETIAVLVVEMLDKVWASNGRIEPDWSILDLDAQTDTTDTPR
ncbi:hypothetical protein [uncultured Zoogloea sp.]|mgnify:FL=1|uniref:hypothetical protein n=1 Tax=uncultured Zoogloea sp. TaxID=160237 RepID=UPI00262687F1|nr:hypothetical protein [uncultured Zoogloea sp.]